MPHRRSLCDALGACTELNAVYRRLLKMTLEELQLLEQQVGQLDQEMASLLSQHQDSVKRLAETPGLGVDSAQQIMAEVGTMAATFPSASRGGPRLASAGANSYRLPWSVGDITGFSLSQIPGFLPQRYTRSVTGSVPHERRTTG